MGVKELIGNRIKRLRQLRRISQARLAEKIGMNSKYLSRIEKGIENPTLDMLMKMSAALDVEVSELFDYEPERSPQELRQFITSVTKETDETKLRLAAKVLKAIYR